MLVPSPHHAFIQQCYDLARQSAAKGNHPFGSMLVHHNRVLLTSENTVNTERDITGHAELNLVRMASQQFSRDMLEQTTLYTSTEPCAMCAGAIYWSGISTVVFGCSGQALGNVMDNDFIFPCREVFERGKRPINVIGPILEAEGIQVHYDCW